jgi:Rrf2 family transcriptional regulator, iron-sulfur cluster assembly transcription factor
MKISLGASYGMHALMFMVRHITQLPMTATNMAKAEGIPVKYLAKILHRLACANIIKVSRGAVKGYILAKSPEQISLRDVLDAIEERPLFKECFMKHCECGGTKENCVIYKEWISVTEKFEKFLAQTSLESATWHHPEHQFYKLPSLTKGELSGDKRFNPSGSKISRRKTAVAKH